jgi:Uma2 family endonuclease
MGAKNLTLATVDQWIERCESEKVELVEGEIVRRANPSADHSYSARKIAAKLDPFDLKKGSGGGPGGWWIFSEAHVVYPARPNGFIHDLAGWRRDRIQERPRGKKILERPDWVCEILSENRSMDLIRKKRVLHENGVPNYWLLDHRDMILSVLRWVEGGYLSVLDVSPLETKGEKIPLEPFSEIEFSIEDLFGIET